jgi:hypothetical protein
MDGSTAPVGAADAEVVIDVADRGNAGALGERWVALASQPLSVLRDALGCQRDLLPYPSSGNALIFAGGAFFVDQRPRDFADMSAPIREFGAAVDAPGPFTACPVYPMDTPFADVVLHIGEQCVVRHYGLCDHTFAVTRVRPLPAPAAQLQRSAYPHRVFVAPQPVTLCDVCRTTPASVATYGDRLCPTNPTLFCAECCAMLHPPEANGDDDDFVKFALTDYHHF